MRMVIHLQIPAVFWTDETLLSATNCTWRRC